MLHKNQPKTEFTKKVLIQKNGHEDPEPTVFDTIGDEICFRTRFGMYTTPIIPVTSNGRMGFINYKGDIVIPLIYKANPFFNKYLFTVAFEDNLYVFLEKEGKHGYGIVRDDGLEMTDFKYDLIDHSIHPTEDHHEWFGAEINHQTVFVNILTGEEHGFSYFV